MIETIMANKKNSAESDDVETAVGTEKQDEKMTSTPLTSGGRGTVALTDADAGSEIKVQRERRVRQRRPRKPGEKPLAKKEVVDFFAGCGRCSFFLAGYRLLFTEESFDDAVAEMEDGYLILDWDQDVRNLVHRSFGVRVDVDFYQYQGRCQECGRNFLMRTADSEEETADFRVALKPEAVV